MAANVELVSSAYEAFRRGDIRAVMEVLAEDITWQVPAILPHGAVPVRGREEVGRFLARLAETWQDCGLELCEFIGAGDRVCVTGRASGRLRGAETGYRFVHCWTVRDGMCTTLEEYVDPDPEVFAASGRPGGGTAA